MSTYKSQNGKTYKFKSSNHKFVIAGFRGTQTAKNAINNPELMEKLINFNSNSIVEVASTSAPAKTENKKPLTGPELIALINEAESADEVTSLVSANETRKTVLAAVDAKFKSLEEATAETGEGEENE